VYVLKPLSEEQIVLLLETALADEERGLGAAKLQASAEVLKKIASYSSGDARSAYNALEVAAGLAKQASGKETGAEITDEIVHDALQKRVLLYDKSGEEHYNLISALHKSVRNSDPDAALYWLGRMLEAGEDPLYVARRLIRFASEDIGLADPQALTQAVAAQQAAHFIGMPEANLALAQAVVYLATAPKSNALYAAYTTVQEDVEKTRADPVPLHLRNAPTPLMRKVGYGKGYRYAHDYEEAQVEQQHLPDAIKDRTYYHPSDRGYEKTVKDRLDAFEAARRKTGKANRPD
jgi:putative ATPase